MVGQEGAVAGGQLRKDVQGAAHDVGATPTDVDALHAHIIGKVWLIDVVTFLSGRMTVSQVLEDLEATIALVMTSSPK